MKQNIQEKNSLILKDKRAIEIQLDELIATHKENTAKINQYMEQRVTTLEASKSRIEKLHKQNLIRKLFNSLKGNNKSVQESINRDLAEAEYYSQLLIQKLAEQNLTCFEMITALNNKLNKLLEK